MQSALSYTSYYFCRVRSREKRHFSDPVGITYKTMLKIMSTYELVIKRKYKREIVAKCMQPKFQL